VLAARLLCAENVQTQSTAAISSPGKQYTAVVDRLLKVNDAGETDQFSGGMMLRVLDSTTSTALRQQYVEGTQVRTLDAPVWLDDTWCAYTYNIAKNANGMVYLNAGTGVAYQLEIVAPPRRMGATNTIEQEVTSIDVNVLGTSTTHIHNVPWKGGSAFPLRLKPLPRFDRKPFGPAFLKELDAGVQQYFALCADNGFASLDVEQASESFNAAEDYVAVLACSDKGPVLSLVPVASGKTESRLYKLEGDMTLNCATPPAAADNSGKTPAPDPTDYARYTTSWKDSETALVEREVFSAENETSHRESLYVADLRGNIKKVPPPARTPQPTTAATAVQPSPVVPTPAKPKAVVTAKALSITSATSQQTSRTRPLLKVTTRKNDAPVASPVSVVTSETPSAGASAIPTPTQTPGRKTRLFDGILPRRSKPAPSATTPAAPPEIVNTPSD
jgi:hypothetical protein